MQQQHPGNSPSVSTASELNLTIRAQTGMAGLLTRKRDPGRRLREFLNRSGAKSGARDELSRCVVLRTGFFRRESRGGHIAPRRRQRNASQTATRGASHLGYGVQEAMSFGDGGFGKETRAEMKARRKKNRGFPARNDREGFKSRLGIAERGDKSWAYSSGASSCQEGVGAPRECGQFMPVPLRKIRRSWTAHAGRAQKNRRATTVARRSLFLWGSLRPGRMPRLA